MIELKQQIFSFSKNYKDQRGAGVVACVSNGLAQTQNELSGLMEIRFLERSGEKLLGLNLNAEVCFSQAQNVLAFTTHSI